MALRFMLAYSNASAATLRLDLKDKVAFSERGILGATNAIVCKIQSLVFETSKGHNSKVHIWRLHYQFRSQMKIRCPWRFIGASGGVNILILENK